MAIGSRYNPGSVPNYMQMGEQSERSAIQSAQGAAGLFERGYKTMSQIEDRQRLEEARGAFDSAWMSKDPDDIQRVLARFPEYAAKIQQSIGVRDDQQRQQVGSMAVQLSGMLESGNIEGAQEIVRQNARLFPEQGGFNAENVASNLGIAAKDPKKLAEMKNWAQKLSLSTLSPKEIMSHGLSQQQMAQQLEMQNNALEQQLRVANQNLGFRYQQMNTMADFRERQLNKPTPTMQNWEFIQNLSPEDKKVFMDLMPGGGGLPAVRQQRQQDMAEFATNPTKPLADRIIGGATIDQRKSAEYAYRMKPAIDKMNRLISEGKMSRAKLGEITKRAGDGTLASMALNPSEQLYVNAAMDIIRAQLRKESGAAISESEWKTAFSHYLPTGADSLELIAEKQSLLNNLTTSAIASSGGVYDAFNYYYTSDASKSPDNSSTGGPKEGATATNKATGEKMVYRNGKWEKS